jgi:hypothetical protein
VSNNWSTRRVFMKTRYLRKIGSLLFAVLMIAGAVFVAPGTAQAQRRGRVVIVRPFGFGPWGWGWGYGYGSWGPYGTYYSQYVFDSSDSALNQAYHDGFKTGRDDGKKDKSYNPQRSHYYRDAGFGNYADVYRSGFSRGYREGYSEGSGRRS